MSSTDAVGRGAVNAIANWPTLVARVIQAFTSYVLIAVVGLLIVWPFFQAASGKGRGGKLDVDWVREVVAEHWLMAFGITALCLAIFLVLILVDAFVSAGNTWVYIEGERLARAGGPYRAFSLEEWLRAARSGMWRVAGITVSVAVVVSLAAAVCFGGVIALGATQTGFGCCAAALGVPLFLAAAILVPILTAKAIIVCVDRSLQPRDALREGWALLTNDFGAHFWAAVMIGIATFCAGAIITAASSLVEIPKSSSNLAVAFFAPVQLAIALAQQVVGAAISCWFPATMTALTPVGGFASGVKPAGLPDSVEEGTPS